ncbi:uncharacterized protein LOC106091767 [Stomoxys calcitrans]|uniref:uncharacterized protein LOC106091767 n=1 Tax=Stomoxys calcitrans TaxID=35570 RepID=UPI0027E2ACF3|nr:uncharacterized protein LOC106091767 [Stomoxys calcitrans]
MSILNVKCPSCSEILLNEDDIYSTSCGHVFHFHCLPEQDSETACPKCYTYGVTTQKLYLSFDKECTEFVRELKRTLDVAERENHDLKMRFNDKNMTLITNRFESNKENVQLKKLVTELKIKIASLESAQQKLRQQVFALNQEVASHQAMENSVNDMATENDKLKQELERINTELAIELSKNQELMADKDTLRSTIKGISEEFQRNVAINTQLETENMRLKSHVESSMAYESSNSSSGARANHEAANTNQNNMENPDNSMPIEYKHHSEQTAQRTITQSNVPVGLDVTDREQSQAFKATGKTNDAYEATSKGIIIQNFPTDKLRYPLEENIIYLAKNMDMFLEKKFIDSVNILNSSNYGKTSLRVKFKAEYIHDTFLENRELLKSGKHSKYIKSLKIKQAWG